MNANSNHRIPRREFIKTTASAGGAAALAWSLPVLPLFAAPASGMRYRPFGRTGLQVSEIGFGGYPVKDPDVIQYAVDKGINYFDTAWDYRGGKSEETIGKGLKGIRDQVVLTTKWHPYSETSAGEMMKMLDTSLRRLQTDHVDCLLVHQVGKQSGGEGVGRLKNPELFKAIEQARDQGKVRFFGCSGHDGDLMDIMNYAITIPEFSVILCRYNFMTYPTEPELFRKARAAGFGVVAMKTLSGARGVDLSGFRDQYNSYKQGALKWALSNPDISNLIISISNRRQVDEYAKASGAAMTGAESAALESYRQRFDNQVCRMCNACEPACPSRIPVADILRYRMYEKEYGWVGEGRKLYTKQFGDRWMDACAGCAAPCLAACPHGIDIPVELKEAKRILKV